VKADLGIRYMRVADANGVDARMRGPRRSGWRIAGPPAPTVDGSGSRPWLSRTRPARRAVARAHTQFARQRRHCCQTAPQGGNRSGR